jgi:hypothetical protein
MYRSGRALLSIAVAILALTSCSTSTSKKDPGTSVGTSTPSTAPAPVTTSGTGPAVRILALTGPKSPLLCNAPTQVELHWLTQNAKKVTLQINAGPVFASYANGARDELVPLACTGDPQTYLVTAHGVGGQTVTRSLTITEHESSSS